MPSLLDILPPEAQAILGIAALVLTALGILVWAAGIKVARGLVAALVGLVVAALAAWTLPNLLDIAVVSAGLVGFAIGALAGAVCFRLLQGLTLAICLGLAVGLTYYHLHVEHLVLSPTVAHVADQAPVKAADLLIKGPLAGSTARTAAPTTTSAHATSDATADARIFASKLLDRWNAISSTDQRRLLAAAIGSAAIALLLAFGFPRPTTLVISAFLGTLMLLAGLEAAFHLYLPKLEFVLPRAATTRYALIALLTAIGLLLQYHFFWPRKKPQPAKQPSSPAPAMGAA
jgi:hypothetical protein